MPCLCFVSKSFLALLTLAYSSIRIDHWKKWKVDTYIRAGREQGKGSPMGKFMGASGLNRFEVLSSEIFGIQALDGTLNLIFMIYSLVLVKVISASF